MSRIVAVLVGVGVVAFAAALSLQDIVSYDYWWQLRTGQLIWETGSVPRVDVFSFTATGSPYIDIHWLFQLGLFAVHAVGGHAAVVIAKLVLVLIVLGLLAPIGADWRDHAAISGFALIACLVVLSERILPRAELPSFVLLALLLFLLDRVQGGRRFALAGIVVLQLVWANTHGLFAVGLAVIAMHVVGDVFDRLSRREPIDPSTGWLAGVLVVSAGVSFLNPNGLEGVLYPIAQLGMIGPSEERALGASIAELQPTLASIGPVQLVFAAALVLGSGLALWLDRERTPARHWFLLVAFVYLGLAARRNLALTAIVCTPLLVTHANGFLREARPLAQRALSGPFAAMIVTALAVLLTVDTARGHFYRRLEIARDPGLGVMRTWFADGAVDWIAQARPPGPIAHGISEGGLVIGRLYPEYRAMVDGRLEVYGAERLGALSWPTPRRFVELDRRHAFGTVIVSYTKSDASRILPFLNAHRDWKLGYLDEVAAVYVRRSAETRHLPEIDARDQLLFGPLIDEGPVQSELRARARVSFFDALDMKDRSRVVRAWFEARYPQGG